MSPSALDTVADELRALDRDHLRRTLAGPLAPGVVNFSSNDYLGLASAPQLAAAAREQLTETTGAGAARLIGADLPAHRQLEQRLATFKGCAAALLFSSGYHANLGSLAALAGPEDAIFSDALNHASIIDGCRLSGARVHVYRHADPAHLEQLLRPASAYRRRLIVSDSIFGMDGDPAPLREIVSLARRYDALTIVDEAHATGVYGLRGRGLIDELDVEVDLQVTTFGKGLGSFGAAALGSQQLIDYLVNRARTFVFTTALPPSICAATTAAITLCDSAAGDALRARLRTNVARFRAGLAALGAPATAPGPIQPWVVGAPQAALDGSSLLAARGYFVQAIRPPTVPSGTSRLRIAISAAHTERQIDGLLAALAQLPPPIAADPDVTSAASSPTQQDRHR